MKSIMHFGAGALGRGFVIPILIDSGCEVIVVDANDTLVEKLKSSPEYKLFVHDDGENGTTRTIRIKDAFSIEKDKEKIIALLKQIDVVTTSVRKENLVHVAAILYDSWKELDMHKKLVLCCENLENSSAYFKSQLSSFATDQPMEISLNQIQVPDIMVDRGCFVSKENDLLVITETFYEIAVDKKMVLDTGICLIPAVEGLEQVFYRKRFLLNTYADATAFMGIVKGLNTFSKAVKSCEIHNELEPYLALVAKSLNVAFGMPETEIERWRMVYRKRNTKESQHSVAAERPLLDIARSMWRKLEHEERFIKPLILLKEKGIDIDSGLYFITMLTEYQARQSGMNRAQTCDRIKKIWCIDEPGNYIYKKVSQALKF